jgi:multicomponent K+:H+ antiporter subunit D
LLPLHPWLPATYAHTSAPVAALFAIMTKVGAYGILRLDVLIFGVGGGPAVGLIGAWLLPLALATLAAGMLGVVASTALRQQAAYLVVASVGSLLIAFGLGTSAGIAAGLYYLPHTTFASGAFFLLADSIASRRGASVDRLVPDVALSDQCLLGTLFFVTAILLVGLPPSPGFIAKFLTLRAAVDHPGLPWVMGTVLVAGLFGLLALTRSGSVLFYRALPAQAGTVSAGGGTLPELLPVAGLLLLCLGLIAWAGPLHDFALATAEQLLQPQEYIRAVLGSYPGAVR